MNLFLNSTSKSIRCLVIQTRGLSYVLQSLMALKATQQLYPQLEIHFLVQSECVDAIKRVPWVKNLIVLPVDEFLNPFFSEEKNKSQILKEIAQWISPLIVKPWDIVLNWSYSESSSFLTALIPSQIKFGYTRKRDSTFSAADGWSQYIHGIAHGAIHQNIHLTDIYTTQFLTALQIHVGNPTIVQNESINSKTFFKLNHSEDTKKLFRNSFIRKKILSFHISNISETQDLSVESWAKLIHLVLENHPEYEIYLLGEEIHSNKAEEILNVLGRDFPDHIDSVQCFVGKANFDLWTYIISQSEWVFSSSLTAVHLASVLGVQVLNFSIESNKKFFSYRELGPYGNGHFILKTSEKDISPEAVYAVWDYSQQKSSLTLKEVFFQKKCLDYFSLISIYKSRIRSTEDGGGVAYDLLNPISISSTESIQEWFACVMGHIARSWYCGWVPEIAQEMKKWPKQLINPKMIQELRELKEAVDVLDKILEKAKITATQISEKNSRMISPIIMDLKDRQEIERLGKVLADLDLLMDHLSDSKKLLKVFAQMNKISMHHLKGHNLTELGKETAVIYQTLKDGVSILKNWIQFTFYLAKPVMLSQERIEHELCH